MKYIHRGFLLHHLAPLALGFFPLLQPAIAFGQQSELAPFIQAHHVNSCCFLNNETVVSASATGELCFWDMNSAKLKKRFQLAKEPLYGLTLVDNAKKVLVVCGYNRLLSFDIAKEKAAEFVKLPCDIGRVIVAPGGKRVFAGCGDGTVRILESTTGRELGCLRAGFPTNLPAKVIAVTSEAISSAPLGPPSDPDVLDISLSSDGKFLAASYECVFSKADNIHVWDVGSLKHIAGFRIVDGTSSGGRIAFDPKEPTTLALFGQDGRAVRRWDVIKGELRGLPAKMPSQSCLVRFSPDGTCLVVTCDDGSLVLVRGSEAPKLLYTYPSPPNWVSEIAFSPDSSLFSVRTSTFDAKMLDRVFVWESATGKPFQRRMQP